MGSLEPQANPPSGWQGCSSAVANPGGIGRDCRQEGYYAAAGLNGEWINDGTTDSLDALCWLLSRLVEDVTPSEILYFRSFRHPEDTGLLVHFRPKDSPFPLPRCDEIPGYCGILLATRITGILESEGRESEAADQNTRMFRALILDLIESLAEEQLDLFLIVN